MKTIEKTAILNIKKLAEERRLGLIDTANFINDLISLEAEFEQVLGKKATDYIFQYANDLKIKDAWEPDRKYAYMTREEQVELILDNIDELYSDNKHKITDINKQTVKHSPLPRKSPTNKEKATKYILELLDKRKLNKISLEKFLYELSVVPITMHTHLGIDYFKKVDKYAGDLEGSLKGEQWRYYKNKMTKEEQEKIIIRNIEKLYKK